MLSFDEKEQEPSMKLSPEKIQEFADFLASKYPASSFYSAQILHTYFRLGFLPPFVVDIIKAALPEYIVADKDTAIIENEHEIILAYLKKIDYIIQRQNGRYNAPEVEDLLAVGPHKPLGYLPIQTFIVMGVSVKELQQISINRGLNTFEIGEFFYVYDSAALAMLLDKHKFILARQRCPMDCEGFIHYIKKNDVDPYNPLFDIISEAFGNTVHPKKNLS